MELLHNVVVCSGDHSVISSDVDPGGLAKVELLVGGLFHEVEERVLKNELHELAEGLLHVHSLAEELLAIDAGYLLEFLFVGLTGLVQVNNVLAHALVRLLVLGHDRVLLGGSSLVCDWAGVDSSLRLVAFIQQLVEFVGLEDVVHGLVDDIFDQGFALAEVGSQVHFGLYTTDGVNKDDKAVLTI